MIIKDLGGHSKGGGSFSYHMLEFHLDSDGSETVVRLGVNLDNSLHSRNSSVFQGRSVGKGSAWQQSKAARLFIDF